MKRKRYDVKVPEPGNSYAFKHIRKGAFIGTFLAHEGEFWRVRIDTRIKGQDRFAHAKIRVKGKKQSPPSVEKLLRPELITGMEPHGLD